MKVLCTTLPEYGHFHPMVPLARALVEAGHEVAFATAAEFCPRVERTGFTAFPAGLNHEAQLGEARLRYPDAYAMAPGQERFLEFVPRMLAGVAAPAMLDDLVPLVGGWRPDIIVHDEADSAGPVAAKAAGIPWVSHGVGILRPLDAIRLAGTTLAPAAEHWGVEVGPLGGMLEYLYLGICPPGVQPPHEPGLEVGHLIRALFDAAPDEGLPPWVPDLPPVPTVYVTMGTIFNRMVGLFGQVLEGLRDEEINVIVTVGYDGDPQAWGPQPANVHIERYIPQSLLLPYCDVVVGQGGWSFLSVLAHGLPMVLMPQGANQFYHSQACVNCGAARRLMPDSISADAIRSEVREVLDNPGYRERASLVQAEMEAMPEPAEVVGLVEWVERERQPLTRSDAAKAPSPPAFTQATNSPSPSSREVAGA